METKLRAVAIFEVGILFLASNNIILQWKFTKRYAVCMIKKYCFCKWFYDGAQCFLKGWNCSLFSINLSAFMFRVIENVTTETNIDNKQDYNIFSTHCKVINLPCTGNVSIDCTGKITIWKFIFGYSNTVVLPSELFLQQLDLHHT